MSNLARFAYARTGFALEMDRLPAMASFDRKSVAPGTIIQVGGAMIGRFGRAGGHPSA